MDSLDFLYLLLAGANGEPGCFCLDFLLAGASADRADIGGQADAAGEREAGGSADEAGGSAGEAGGSAGEAGGEAGPSGVLMRVQSEAGGEGSTLVCGGDFIRQLPRAFGLPRFLFSPSGTALT